MAVVLDTSTLIELERSLRRDEPPAALGEEEITIPAIVGASNLSFLEVQAAVGQALAAVPGDPVVVFDP